MTEKPRMRPWIPGKPDEPYDPEKAKLASLSAEARDFVTHFERYVVMEDDDVLVLNKPPWVPIDASVHHSMGLQQLVEMVRTPAPVYVHRLDKNTSGVILFAKTAAADQDLRRQFHDRKTKKSYIALVDGKWNESVSGIIAPLTTMNEGERVHVDSDPDRTKIATTAFRPIAELHDRGGKPKTLLAIRIFTGRTHQIRAHVAHLQHPITGDHVYNPDRNGFRRQLLHAYRITFYHPTSEAQITVHAPLADDFRSYVQSLTPDSKEPAFDELFQDPPKPQIIPASHNAPPKPAA